MQKIVHMMSMLAFSVAVSAYAGGMGSAETAPPLYTFLGAEGGYSWNDVHPVLLNSIDSGADAFFQAGLSSMQNSGGSARIYAGLMRLIYRNALYFSGEVGWGYYGKTSLFFNFSTDDPNANNYNGSTLTDAFNGFDALIGLSYNQPRFDLFLKAGALLQNSNLNADIVVDQPQNSTSTDFSHSIIGAKLTLAQILPEIKVGGACHVNENLLVSAAYAHAFGYATQANMVSTSCSNSSGSNCLNGTLNNTLLNVNVNPSMDMLLLGLEYRFA